MTTDDHEVLHAAAFRAMMRMGPPNSEKLAPLLDQIAIAVRGIIDSEQHGRIRLPKLKLSSGPTDDQSMSRRSS
jgi:hypothetical protein